MPTDATLLETPLQTAAGQDRRGPLRPSALVTARERRSALFQLEFLKLADLVALGALAVLIAAPAFDEPLLGLTLDKALPFVLAPVVAAWALDQLGMYRPRAEEPLWRRLGRLLLGLGLAGVGGAVLALAFSTLGAVWRPLGLWAAAAFTGCGTLHVIAWIELGHWLKTGRLKPNILVVGATAHAERLIRAALARQDMHVIGVFDDRLARAPDAVEGVPVLGDTAALVGHRVLPHVDRVVLALDPSARSREIATRLAILPNEVSLLVDLSGDGREDAALARIASSALAKLSGPPDDRRRQFAKRLQDLLIGSAALILLSPVLAVIALLVRLDSPGPVFFRQRRHGFNNEEIVVWKFRSMRHEAQGQTMVKQVTKDDDRVTRVGRIIRSASLDELPQLLNVLAGEMSLVGPRPHAIGMKTGDEESAKLVAEYAWRHRIKPGLTGWAAVNGSRGPLHEAEEVRRRVALDLEYVERQSFWFDIWIMLKTVPCLLGDRLAVR
jgi:Undecaprenyl-phosphate glucose phosphotransferase